MNSSSQKIYRNFVKVPHRIFDIGLNPNELSLLTYLLTFFNAKEIYPSKQLMASCCNVSIRTVDKTLNSLVNKGLITYKKGRKCKQARCKHILSIYNSEVYCRNHSAPISENHTSPVHTRRNLN